MRVKKWPCLVLVCSEIDYVEQEKAKAYPRVLAQLLERPRPDGAKPVPRHQQLFFSLSNESEFAWHFKCG